MAEFMMLKVISMTFVKKTDCEIMHRISANPDTLGAPFFFMKSFNGSCAKIIRTTEKKL